VDEEKLIIQLITCVSRLDSTIESLKDLMVEARKDHKKLDEREAENCKRMKSAIANVELRNSKQIIALMVGLVISIGLVVLYGVYAL